MNSQKLLNALGEAIEKAPTEQIPEIEERLRGLLLWLNRPKPKPLKVQAGLVEAWADGSCLGNPGPGGWAFVLRQGSQETEGFGSSPKSTNNIMELTAAIRALEAVPPGTPVRMTTDSQYVVKGINQWIHGWKKKNWKKSDGEPVVNQEQWKRLDELCQERKVEWLWVKGHAGHEENERCDQLAREAALTASG